MSAKTESVDMNIFSDDEKTIILLAIFHHSQVVEDVSETGHSGFVTLGDCRASHRKTTPNEAFNSVGIPYHRSYKEDLMPLEPGVPVKLEFCIDAISYVFAAGHSIRVTLVCAEEKTYQQPEGFDYENPPTITLYTGGDKASLVKLPIG